MIPLRAEKAPGFAAIVWLLAAGFTALLVRLAYLPDDRAGAIVSALGVVPARFLAAPASPGQLATLLTSAFLHAGWVHLAGNVLYLVVFGPRVEARLGRMRFLALFLSAGMAGALAHVASNPGSSAPLVGASGAIAGVLGAYLVLEPRSKITTLIVVEIAVLPAAFVIAMWFALQLVSAVAPVASGADTAVAWFAHLGGFAAGAATGAIAASKPSRDQGKTSAGGRRRAA